MNYGKQIIEYCRKENYRIKEYNIIYLEGCDNTFELNNDKLNEWNDLRLIVKEDGDIVHNAIATTEPGSHYTFNPMNPKGAFRIAFGQYLDAWTFGIHGRSRQDALVQCAPVKGFRDFNEDGLRIGDAEDIGIFGINQHWGRGLFVDYWSAGCLVAKFEEGHAKFMKICRETGYKTFDTIILPADKLKELKVI